MKNAGMIDQRKDGKWIEYFIADEKTRDFLIAMASYLGDKEQIDADRTA